MHREVAKSSLRAEGCASAEMSPSKKVKVEYGVGQEEQHLQPSKMVVEGASCTKGIVVEKALVVRRLSPRELVFHREFLKMLKKVFR